MLKNISLSKRFFDSLLLLYLRSIKKNEDPVFGKLVLNCTRLTSELHQRIRTFVTEARHGIENNTFRAEKYKDPVGTRGFTMVPIYSFQQRNVTFNASMLLPVPRQCGLFQGRKLSDDQLRSVIWGNFDMQRVGLQSEQSLETEKLAQFRFASLVELEIIVNLLTL
jgi:hypothetical protein